MRPDVRPGLEKLNHLQAFQIVLDYLRAYRDGATFHLPPLSHRRLLALRHEADFYGLAELADLVISGVVPASPSADKCLHECPDSQVAMKIPSA